jgi:hypothetical protein
MEFLFAGFVSAFVACVILATKSYHLKYTAKGLRYCAPIGASHTNAADWWNCYIFWLYRGNSDVAV